MARSGQIALLVTFFGVLSFVLGILAEQKKPAAGTPIPGMGVVICKFPNDLSIALGVLSILAVIISTVLGVFAVFFPYEGKYVPKGVIFGHSTLCFFMIWAVSFTFAGILFTSWATLTEFLYRVNKVHHNLDETCPTAETGVFGGAAFLNLDAALLWLMSQMLAVNAREDYFDGDDDDEGNGHKGDYGVVVTGHS